MGAISSETHAVTVSVPDILDLTANRGAFTLTFADFINGSNTGTRSVTYTVKANNMTQTNGAAVIAASLDTLYPNVNFRANPGTYTLTGGAVTMTQAAAGYITIGTGATALTIKGGSGRILRGSIPIVYRATATADLPSGNTVQALTVTLSNV